MLSARNSVVPFIRKNPVLLYQFSSTKVPYCFKMSSTRVEPHSFKPIPSKAPQLKVVNKQGMGIGGWFLLLVPITTFCLGTWQIKRKKWKEELNQSLLSMTREPAVPLPSEDSEVSKLEFRKVHVRGHFDHEAEMYLGPRSLLLDGQSAYEGKLMSTAPNNASGYLVITPFILSDTKERILVNRGWVAFPNKNPKTRPKGQINKEVELEGVVRLTEPRPQFTPVNKPDARVWFSRDVETMAAEADTRPVFIDATAESTVEGGPVGGQTVGSLRDEHLSYIFTWYGISIGTAIIWFQKYIK